MDTLTTQQADLIYGMLTQRLYLRTDDPERETVQGARNAIYPQTSVAHEADEARLVLALPATPDADGRDARFTRTDDGC